MRTFRRALIVLGSLTAYVCLLLGLVAFPIPHSFAFSYAGLCDLCTYPGLSIPVGARVSGTWEAPRAVQFYVMTSMGETVYFAIGMSGSFSFMSDGGTYYFGSFVPPFSPSNYPVANVSGTYWSPLLSETVSY